MESAILEAVRKCDWKRLGVLLGVQDPELGHIVAAWSALPQKVRQAILLLAQG